MTIQQFSFKLSEFRKNSKYNEGLMFFKQNKKRFSIEEIKSDSYIIFNIIFFLKKTNNCNYIFQFLKTFEIDITSLNKIITENLGWCILSKEFMFNIEKYLFFFKDFIPILEKYEERDILSLLLKKGIELIENSKILNNNSYLLMEFLTIFNPLFLNETKKYFSIKESYFLKLSKLYLEMKNYKNAIVIAKNGLNSIQYFHNTDIWLKRNIALSEIELSNLDEALSILENLYKKKKDWFFLYDIARIFYKKENFETSFEYLIEIMNLNIPIKNKVKTIFLIGVILEKIGKNEIATQHFILLGLIYKKENWKIKQEINEKIENINLENYDYHKILKELNLFWQSSDKTLKVGKIKKIIHNNEKGVVGFILSDNKEYYFSLLRKNKLSKFIKVGINVKIKIKDTKAYIESIIR